MRRSGIDDLEERLDLGRGLDAHGRREVRVVDPRGLAVAAELGARHGDALCNFLGSDTCAEAIRIANTRLLEAGALQIGSSGVLIPAATL
jgi:hypothetical protein